MPLLHPPHCRHATKTAGDVARRAGFVREKHDGRHDHADTEEPGEAAEELGGAEQVELGEQVVPVVVTPSPPRSGSVCFFASAM